MTEKTHEEKTIEASADAEASIMDFKYEKTKTGKAKRVTVPLEFPFDFDNVHYAELSFRRMKVKDTYSGEGEEDETKAGLMVYAKMAGVSIDILGEVDGEDLERITEALIPLMGKSASKVMQEEMAKKDQ